MHAAAAAGYVERPTPGKLQLKAVDSIAHCHANSSNALPRAKNKQIVFVGRVGWLVRSLTFVGPNISKTIGDRGSVPMDDL